MWLADHLAPDFTAIARFRKDNGKAIRSVCGQLVVLCQRLDLFAEAIVAIDGSKFEAMNHLDRIRAPLTGACSRSSGPANST